MSELLTPRALDDFRRTLTRDLRGIVATLSEYATTASDFAQPLGTEPVAGRGGYQELIEGVNPAAGESFRYRVPGEIISYPLSVMAQLATSAVVAERTLTLEYQDGQDVRYLVAGANVELEASQTQAFCWQPLAGAATWPVDDAAIAPLPQQFIYPTHSLVLKIGNVQAGDALSLIRLSVYQFETGSVLPDVQVRV